jgi:hypothetical protein
MTAFADPLLRSDSRLLSGRTRYWVAKAATAVPDPRTDIGPDRLWRPFQALDPQPLQQPNAPKPERKKHPDGSIFGNFSRTRGHGPMVLRGFDFFHLQGEVRRLSAVRRLQEGVNHD